MKKMDEDIKRHIKEKYDTSSQHFIFLDYDGTLVPFSDDPATALPGKEIKELLTRAASIKQNNVIIISGRDKRFLDNIFQGMKVTLVAEHGAFTRKPGHEWSSEKMPLVPWKKNVRRILSEYLENFPGSLLEDKERSLAWHYRNCEPFPTIRQIDALKVLLHQETNGVETELLQGKMVLEIKEKLINKGMAAMQLLHDIQPGFILAIGDDVTDEDLFQALPEDAITIKVGTDKSAAKYFCENQQDVADLIRLFVNETFY